MEKKNWIIPIRVPCRSGFWRRFQFIGTVMDTVIVVIGGMGPMAGIECLKYITSNCETDGTDQDNLNVILLSFPALVDSRVDFVLGHSSVNPSEAVLHFLKPQLDALQHSYKRIVIGVPCITFHCSCIFSLFRTGVSAMCPCAEVVSIISATTQFIKEHCQFIKRVGIISTDGTRQAKPFAEEFSTNGIHVVYLTDEQQSVVTDCIFNVHWYISLSYFTL